MGKEGKRADLCSLRKSRRVREEFTFFLHCFAFFTCLWGSWKIYCKWILKPSNNAEISDWRCFSLSRFARHLAPDTEWSNKNFNSHTSKYIFKVLHVITFLFCVLLSFGESRLEMKVRGGEKGEEPIVNDWWWKVFCDSEDVIGKVFFRIKEKDGER